MVLLDILLGVVVVFIDVIVSDLPKMFLHIHIPGGSIMRTLEQKRIGKLMKKRKSERTCIMRIYSHGHVLV